MTPDGFSWNLQERRFSFRSPYTVVDRLKAVVLKPGESGKTRAVARGKGDALTFPALPLVPPVVVQLHSQAGRCWEATYSIPRVNDGERFVANPD